MGQDAVKQYLDNKNEEPTATVVDIDPNEEGAEGAGPEGEEKEKAEGEKVEVVLEDDGETHPKKEGLPKWVHNRVHREKVKVEKAQGEVAEVLGKVEHLENENRVLKLALQQKPASTSEAPVSPPNPDDFEDGVYDAEYQAQLNDYHVKSGQEAAKKAVAEATQQNATTQSQELQAKKLEQKKYQHYERALKLGAKDYEETEQKAIDTFGEDIVDRLIEYDVDDTEILLYYFGKNPSVAEKYANLLKSNPIKGMHDMGKLSAKIKVKKPKTTALPNPDDELEGSHKSSSRFQDLPGATFE